MSQKVIVSGCRKINLLILLVGVVVLGAYVAHEDLTSDGLRRTQSYLLVGNLIYPLFYGACLFVSWKLITLYRDADSFVCIDGPNLLVWSKEIPLREISSISVKRGFLFLQSLAIKLNDGTETKISSLALARPILEAASRIKAAAALS
jgi:hypothetical protein